MFGHNYTKSDHEVVSYLYLCGIILHGTAANADRSRYVVPVTLIPVVALPLVVWISTIVNNFWQDFERSKGQASFDLHSSFIPGNFNILLNYYAKNIILDAFM